MNYENDQVRPDARLIILKALAAQPDALVGVQLSVVQFGRCRIAACP